MEKRNVNEKSEKQEAKVEEKKASVSIPAKTEKKEVKHSKFCSSSWSDVCNCGAK